MEFAHRWQTVAQKLESIKDIHLRGQWQDKVPLFKLAHALKAVAVEASLQRSLAAMEVKSQVFDQLRAAMRLAEVGGLAGLNSGSEPIAMGLIQKAVQEFRQRITTRLDYPTPPHWKAMIAQLDK